MKFLLDTNIWSYVADTDSLPDLLRASRKKGVEFQIAPASIFEARALGDSKIRKKLLAVMTNPAWKRLMPDTYVEAEEIKNALLSARPDWKNLEPNDRDFTRGRFYFLRSKGGFWDHARDEVPRPITNESIREQIENELARQEVRKIRAQFKEGNQAGAETHLQKITLDIDPPILGKSIVDYWRHATAYHLMSELEVYSAPYREWLDCFIDVDAIFKEMDAFEKIWYQTIQPHELKRQWLRGSMEYLQRWHKPTDGSPADSQLTVHAIDADYFVTADKNFARCLEKINAEAPFKTAKPLRVPAGREGVTELINLSKA